MSPPRIGFLGVGWIGRHRMQAMLATGAIEAVAISDPSESMATEAQGLAPAAAVVPSLDAMLALGLDGVVIATPSAFHADQSIAALTAGAAVFCQKPLGRDAIEAARVVAAAEAANRLLGVDFSYRHTAGMVAIAELVKAGELGPVHAVNLTFHNAYGPDKSWFYDRAQSGGGCIMDLGVHLVDLALWTLGFPEASGAVSAQLFANGQPLQNHAVEDFANASVVLANGTVIRLTCSWRLHAGQDAVIEAAFYGRDGGAALRNVNGSFFDFTAERFTGTTRETLASPPDDWGGRAGVEWAMQLARFPHFDPACETIVDVSRVLDRIYAAA